MRYLLSICIPAYDRSHCLDELITSIVAATDDGKLPVQICIGDDAAPPATGEVVRRWQARYPHIVYFRFPTNGGIDRNILKSVELAEGEYCWLMGDDDKIEPDAVSVIEQRLAAYGRPTVLNVNGSMYDRDLVTRLYPRVRRGVRKNSLQEDTVFDNVEDIVRTFGESFGFLGDNVFHRESWQQVVSCTDLSQYDGSVYVHLAVLIKMLEQSPRLLYVHHQCVGFRGNNDGHLKILGEVRRLKLDVEGYHRVASGVFSESHPLYRCWMSRIVAVHARSRVWGIKRSGSRDTMRQVISLTVRYYWRLPAFWIHLAPLLFLPRWTLLALRAVYHTTVNRGHHVGSRS
jgi:abequosyltransferase